MLKFKQLRQWVDLIWLYVIIKTFLSKEQIKNEKEFKDALEYRREAPTRFSQQDGYKSRPGSFGAPSQKRQKTNQHLMLQKLAINLIKIYQGYIRSVLPSSCVFIPSCSEYTKQAILKYGFLNGSLRALRRLLCCHPYSGKSGYDPLPH